MEVFRNPTAGEVTPPIKAKVRPRYTGNENTKNIIYYIQYKNTHILK